MKSGQFVLLQTLSALTILVIGSRAAENPSPLLDSTHVAEIGQNIPETGHRSASAKQGGPPPPMRPCGCTMNIPTNSLSRGQPFCSSSTVGPAPPPGPGTGPVGPPGPSPGSDCKYCCMNVAYIHEGARLCSSPCSRPHADCLVTEVVRSTFNPTPKVYEHRGRCDAFGRMCIVKNAQILGAHTDILASTCR